MVFSEKLLQSAKTLAKHSYVLVFQKSRDQTTNQSELKGNPQTHYVMRSLFFCDDVRAV